MSLRRRLGRLHTDESGVALLTALLGVVILAGLAVVFLGRATAETRAAGVSQNYESTLHVVEAAADLRIAAIAADGDHVTVDATGEEITLPADLDGEAAEALWAAGLLDVMRLDDNDTVVLSEGWLENAEGQAFAVRPRSEVFDPELGEFPPADVIYAVGAVPSFDANGSTRRVLKLQVDQAVYVPEYAILTQAAFRFGGNAAVIAPGCDTSTPERAEETCYADVHTNQEYTQSGNSSRVDGQISTSSPTCPTTTAALGCKADASVRDIPRLEALSFYKPGAEVNTGPSGQPVEWIDLCPNGEARDGNPAGGPCTGALRWPLPGDGSTSHRGWRWRPSQNEWRADSLQSGVFYVHHADANIRGSEGTEQHAATVIVSQNPANPGNSGSLDIAGNPRLQSALKDLLLLTDADLTINGTAAAGGCEDLPETYSGLIAVGEQFRTLGTVSLHGAVIVQDARDEHALVRRGSTASIGGTMCLRFDRDLALELEGQWVVTFWNEL